MSAALSTVFRTISFFILLYLNNDSISPPRRTTSIQECQIHGAPLALILATMIRIFTTGTTLPLEDTLYSHTALVGRSIYVTAYLVYDQVHWDCHHHQAVGDQRGAKGGMGAGIGIITR
jgi:hypothetical protein